MEGFAFAVIVLGLLMMAGIGLWLLRKRLPAAAPMPVQPEPALASDAPAVLLATRYGQLLHVNAAAAAWLGTDQLSLEAAAARARPADHFLSLFAAENQTVFQFADRWVQASSHRIVLPDGEGTIAVLHDLVTFSPSGLDMSRLMQIVSDFTNQTDAGLGLAAMARSLVDLLLYHMPCDAGELYLWRPDEQAMQPIACGGDEALLDQIRTAELYPPDVGLPGWVARYRQPLRLDGDEAQQADLLAPDISAAAIPLLKAGSLLGALAVFRQATGRFSASDTALLQALGPFVVTLITDSQHIMRERELVAAEQAELRELSQVIGTLMDAAQATALKRDPEAVLRTVADLMLDALGMDACTIMIWDEIDNHLEVQIEIDRAHETEDLSVRGKRCDLADYPARLRTLRQREVSVLPDQAADAHRTDLQELADMRSQQRRVRMLVPLVVRDQAIGLIQLDQTSSDPATTTRTKVQLARALGGQVAIAIENARLASATNARFEELLTINALSQAIASTLDMGDLLRIVREQVPGLITDAEAMYLALYDTDTAMITFPLAISSGQDFDIRPRQLGADEVSYVIKNGRTVSLGADYFSLDELRRSMGIENGEGDIRSYMGVPLAAADDVLGVLAVRSQTRKRAFNLNDERLLLTVASQLSAAIQNVRLFQQISSFADDLERLVEARTDELQSERDRFNMLYQITSEMARTLDMDQLLGRALDMVSTAVGATDGVIFLSDPATDQLHARTALNPATLTTFEGHHPTETLASRLIQSERGQTVLVPDLRMEPDWDADAAADLRSAVGVVLETNEDAMGVMVMLSDQVAAFDERHLKLLVPASSQIAAAINSADLYHLMREQADRLGKLLRAEQEEAQKNSAILESIADGVMLADASGRIILFNSAAERILKLARHEVQNRSLDDLAGLYGESGLRWSRMMHDWAGARDQREGLPADDFLSAQIEAGDRIISSHLSPVYIGQNFLGTVSIFRDITREVEVDRIKSEFIENVSHEFRTPLTPIKGYADLLLMGAGGPLSDKQLEMVTTIRTNAQRLTGLVNDVLNITMLDKRELRLSMSAIDLAELLPDLLQSAASQPPHASKAIDARAVMASDLPVIKADRERLAMIISNLLDNAFNYTLPGGKIELAASRHSESQVLITVADTGVGIPDEYQEAVWRRFERYQPHAVELDVAGTGLGLPLVRELVSLHHGEVWLESELGQGTTFFVLLPIDQPTGEISSEQLEQTTGV